MGQELLVEVGKDDKIELVDRDPSLVRLHPWLLLGSIAAFLCLQLEVSLLEQIDSLTQYMTPAEIARDTGVALLFVPLGTGIGAAIPSGGWHEVYRARQH